MSAATGPARRSWVELARAAAREPERAETSLARELLVVELAPDLYAIPVERVREIVRLRPLTELPRVPPAVLGVLPLRGEMLQVLDLRARLGLPAAAAGRGARIVVLHGPDGQLAGLRVDRVAEVARVGDEALSAPPPGATRAVTALALRDGRFVSLLDVDRVLDLGDAG
jgi:purine-binding chemotaxis protein CheW